MDVLLINADGLVENCISADSVARARQFYPSYTCIRRTNAMVVGPGWTFDGVNFAPPKAVKEPPPTTIRRQQFMRRFTRIERVAIKTSADPEVADYMDLLASDPDVSLLPGDLASEILAYLESINIIAPGRAAVVLGA